MKPKVSVIMPSLNVKDYIVECMDSVINQTLKDIEIICVDAGSTDGTLDILRNYEKQDERVKVVLSEKRSYGYQINKGIDVSTGEYVGIVETDDYVLPKMYETLYNAATENHVDFVRSDFSRFYGEGSERKFQEVPLTYWKKNYERFYNTVLNPEDDLHVFNLLKNNVTGIYDINFLRENNIRLNETPGASFQDNGLWFFTFMYAKRALFLNKSFYQCRRDNPNSSVNDKGKAFIVCNEYDYILNCLKSDDEKYRKFIYAYWVGKFGSYFFTYSRVSEKLKYPFLHCLYTEFMSAKERGELRQELFPSHHWEKLCKILDDPIGYYVNDFRQRTSKSAEDKNSLMSELSDAIAEETEIRLNNRQDKTVKVSVIIPVYNLEQYLRQCMDSVLSQSIRDFEVLCVDDGSTDMSLAVLQT